MSGADGDRYVGAESRRCGSSRKRKTFAHATKLIRVVLFDDQADIARDAFAKYGKGYMSAALNFGDCAAYALAVSEAEPLLLRGTDFGATYIDAVV